MKRSTASPQLSYIASRVHLLVVAACLTLALSGHMPKIVAGWVVWPPVTVVSAGQGRRRGHRRGGRRCSRPVGPAPRLGRHYLRRTWRVPVCRCLLLALLWQLSQGGWPWRWVALPWLVWGWQLTGTCWPRLRRQPEWRLVGQLGDLIEWLVVVGAMGAVATAWIQAVAQIQRPALGEWSPVSSVLCMGGCVTCGRQAPSVTVDRLENGDVSATLCGHFTLHVPGDDPFRVRSMAVFLRQLEVPGFIPYHRT